MLLKNKKDTVILTNNTFFVYFFNKKTNILTVEVFQNNKTIKFHYADNEKISYIISEIKNKFSIFDINKKGGIHLHSEASIFFILYNKDKKINVRYGIHKISIDLTQNDEYLNFIENTQNHPLAKIVVENKLIALFEKTPPFFYGIDNKATETKNKTVFKFYLFLNNPNNVNSVVTTNSQGNKNKHSIFSFVIDEEKMERDLKKELKQFNLFAFNDNKNQFSGAFMADYSLVFSLSKNYQNSPKEVFIEYQNEKHFPEDVWLCNIEAAYSNSIIKNNLEHF